MVSLSQSAFLQALGWAIANSLWQMALLWGGYQLCFIVFRNALASVKTTVSTLSLFGGFIWFLSSLMNHYWQLRSTPPYTGLFPDHPFPLAGHTFRSYINEALGESEHYLPYLSFAYLLVLACLLIRVVKAYRHVQQVRYEGLTKIEAHWRVYVQELANRIGITREIKVWLSSKIDIPATVGYLKPLVLLPVASINHLTPEQVEAILLHELAHIKRNDYLLNLVITVVETILFFNPFAHLLTRHIKTERENSCDDFVLQFSYSPYLYASALLSLEQQRGTPELAMMAAGKKTDLLDRIKRIMNVQGRPMNYGQKLTAFLVTTGILVSLAWLTPGPAQIKTPAHNLLLVAGTMTPLPFRHQPIPVDAPMRVDTPVHPAKIHPVLSRQPVLSGQTDQTHTRVPEEAGMAKSRVEGQDPDLPGFSQAAAATPIDHPLDSARKLIQNKFMRKVINQGFRRQYQSMAAITLRKALFYERKAKATCETGQEEEYLTGIEADQPGWQNPERETTAGANSEDGRAHITVIPAHYIALRKKAIYNYAYKERITIANPGKSSFSDRPGSFPNKERALKNKRIPISYFLQMLTREGVFPENKILRINKDGNTLLINDRMQTKAVYSLFKACFAGENVLIIENGEVVQITIH